MPETLAQILRAQRQAFADFGVESPALSADLLLAEALGIERQELLAKLILEPEGVCPQAAQATFLDLNARRLAGEPVAYILGRKEFYGRDFGVNRHTLIPRPETELIIDCALDWAAQYQPQNHRNTEQLGCFADLGTGSGCLAITLALELPGWRGLALDISGPALELAQENAHRLGVTIAPDAPGSLEFLAADLTCFEFAPGSLDLLVSNPPYVSTGEYDRLDKGVRDFEPRSALVPIAPNTDLTVPPGAELLAPLCALAAHSLKPGGLFLMEIGCNQGDYMRALLHNNPAWREAEVLRDLAGLYRTVRAIKY